LISGGGSALVTVLLIPLEELQALTSALLSCGARIDEINTVRRHLDRIKGGGLACATKARIISLILSDVIGNPLDAIASGPTAPDPTTIEDASMILKKYKLEDHMPISSLKSLFPFPFSRVQNIVIGDNTLAAQAALEQAQREGFDSEILTNELQGEAREVGMMLAGKMRDEISKHPRPFCLIAGGETTVTVRGGGKGGRNQELALSVVDQLRGLENVMLISLATDGEDGPTEAAGAVVTGESARRAESLGLDVADHLSINDAYHYFDTLGDLIKTGPSGTNVNDLIFLIGLGG
jgi:hydroxypyruvate reductase